MHNETEVKNPFSGTAIESCYQCGKCTAGCPMADRMDLMPNQLFRLVQLGELDRALKSQAIWQCVSCLTCTTRCPQSVECVAIIDALREMAVEKGFTSREQQRTYLFAKAFLDNIRKNGRVHEVELIGRFKMMGFAKDLSVPLLMKDAMLGPKMMWRRKLHVLPKRANDGAVVERIFARCMGEAIPDASEASAADSEGGATDSEVRTVASTGGESDES